MQKATVSQGQTGASPSAPSAGTLQRACACGQHSYGEGECAECKKRRGGMVQRAAAGSAQGVAPPVVHEVLSSPGQPLAGPTRAALESRFGHDFSQVRVHTGPRAAESARAVNALAYTVGQNVVFGGGQYAPGTQAGQRLLAHELAHVVQQRHRAGPLSRLAIGPANDIHEQEASWAADLPGAQQRALVSSSAPLQVQRQRAGAGSGSAAAPAPSVLSSGRCSQQDIDEIRSETLVWLDDIGRQLLTYTVDEVTLRPGDTPSADHQRIAASFQQAFNTKDADYIDLIRMRFKQMADVLREEGRVTITCGGPFCTDTTPAYAVAPYALVLCSKGPSGKQPIALFIHELAHATLPQVGIRNPSSLQRSVRDRAYITDRVFQYLSPEEALDNADSYQTLAYLLRERANVQVLRHPTDTVESCAQPGQASSATQTTRVLTAFARAARWNSYAQQILSDYQQYLDGRSIGTLVEEDRRPLDNYFPGLTNAGLGDLVRGYTTLHTKAFSRPAMFTCASGSAYCKAGSIGFVRTGSLTASSVSLSAINSTSGFNLCAAWFSASEDDQIRSLYALLLIKYSSEISSFFRSANAYSYVDLARAIELRDNPAPTTQSAFDHFLADQPSTQPSGPPSRNGTTAPRP